MDDFIHLPAEIRLEIIEHINLLKSIQDVSLLHQSLYRLWELVDSDEIKEPICVPQLQFLVTLKNLLNNHPPPVIIWNITGILWFLSRNHRCKSILSNPTTGILPILMTLVQHRSEYQDHIINLLSNLSLDLNSHDYLLTPSFHFLDMINRVMHERPQYFQIYKCIAGFTKIAKNPDYIAKIIGAGITSHILNTLLLSPANPDVWEDGANGPTAWSLSFTCSFSSHLVGVEAIKAFNHPEFFLEVVSHGKIQGMQAAMILANVYHDEISDQSGPHLLTSIFPNLLLRQRSQNRNEGLVLDVLLDLLDITIYFETSPSYERYENWNYGYGIIQLREILIALKNISLLGNNTIIEELLKRQLLLSLTCNEVVKAYVNNEEQFSVIESTGFRATSRGGGGGEDHESIASVLELAIQLAFYVEKEYSNNLSLLRASRILKSNLLQQLTTLPNDRNIPSNIRQLTTLLLQYYDE